MKAASENAAKGITPESIEFCTVSNADEVHEILDLQAANLPSSLTSETMVRYGFVTVRHEASVLRRMNEIAPAILAKAHGRVVGYALMMPRSFADDVPILRPLFERLDTLSWNGEPLRGNPRWFVMGQICIADGYRGTGIFEGLYRTMGQTYGDRFDLTVTEVAARNARSLRCSRPCRFSDVAHLSRRHRRGKMACHCPRSDQGRTVRPGVGLILPAESYSFSCSNETG